MTVTLCLCMNRPYQFYYFVPLVSFWFLVVYLVLALPPQVTAASSESNPLQYLYLVLKFVGLFSVITIFYMSEVNSHEQKVCYKFMNLPITIVCARIPRCFIKVEKHEPTICPR